MELTYFFSLAIVVIRKSFKIFTLQQEKPNAIKLFGQTKLGSIADIIPQAMQDRYVILWIS